MTSIANKSIALLVIDPQVDFHPGGSLQILTADADSERLANFINAQVKEIDQIYISLDSHNIGHIATSIFWVSGTDDTKHPDPFTFISHEDVSNGVWKSANPEYQKHALEYTRALEAIESDTYRLIVWPDHCIIGTNGHKVTPPLLTAAQSWEAARSKTVEYAMKGMNNMTEMYSILKAEVPVDAQTSLNTKLLETLATYDMLIVGGQALSHCVKYSVLDVLKNWSNDNARMVVLSDGSSPVAGFEESGRAFLDHLKAVGVQVMTIKECEEAIRKKTLLPSATAKTEGASSFQQSNIELMKENARLSQLVAALTQDNEILRSYKDRADSLICRLEKAVAHLSKE